PHPRQVTRSHAVSSSASVVQRGHIAPHSKRMRRFVQMMTLDLDDTQAALLLVALDRIIDDDKYPLSRGKLKPYPTREPLPPLKPYEPPRVGRGRRRGE